MTSTGKAVEFKGRLVKTGIESNNNEIRDNPDIEQVDLLAPECRKEDMR